MKNYFHKNKMSIEKMLQNKFIISLEGNDVATSLKWILASSSVPIMPAPTAETWLMEGTLIPWIHYAPIENDTSDLLEVLDILLSNPKLSESIATNGKDYMKKFLNKENEEKLQSIILKRFVLEKC